MSAAIPAVRTPMNKLSIGSWAFLFNQEVPTTDFHELLHNVANLGYDGIELGGFAPHPNADSHDTTEKRQKLRRMVETHGLEFSALAADVWSQKLVSAADNIAFLAAFEKNLIFAQDLGIKTIRLDTVEPIAVMREKNLDAQRVMDRVVAAFDRCAKLAAPRGINIAWEFEPGFPLNKPAEILSIVQRVRDELANANFGVLFDTCHAHMCAAVGANQIGQKETLPGGELELLHKLKGKITHLHLIDSDGTLNEHHTSTHTPLGQGKLDFNKLLPELMRCGVPNDWWCVDLCFWPNAWEVAGECRRFLDKLRRKHSS
jgi:sugar phosphate isomerase/epimerase